MSGIVCVVQWDRSHQLRPMVEKAIKDMCAFDHLHSEIVLDEEDICIGSVFRDHAAAVHRFPEEIAVVDGVVCSTGNAGLETGHTDLGTGSLPFDGLYNVLVWRPIQKTLRVSSDVMGVKPLYCWTNGTTLVLSSELKTFRLIPFVHPKLNPRVFASTLVLGYALDGGTLIDGVEVLPAGHGVKFQSGKASRFPLGTWRFTRDRHHASEADLVEELDSVLATSISVWTRRYTQPLVSLSGGVDSRTALAYCLRLAPDTVAASWGMPGSEDLLCAEEIARRAGCLHLPCLLSADRSFSREEIECAAWQLECFSAVNLPFYGVPWFRFLTEQGRPVVHGYIGDVVAGDMLNEWGLTDAELELDAGDVIRTLWSLAARSNRGKALSKFSAPGFMNHLTVDLGDGMLAAYGQFDGERAYQRLVQLNLYTRQRRYIGTSAPRLCEIATDVVLPFYTRTNLEFFASVPLRQLRDRRLVRQLLLKRFPRLARVREADHGRPPVAGNLLQHAVDRLRSSPTIRRMTGRNEPIDSFAVFDRLADRHRRVLAEAIGDAHELVSGAMDMRRIAAGIRNGADGLDREALMRLYNVSVFLRRFFT